MGKRIGVVLPVFNAFNDAVEALLHVHSSIHIWTPYIMPQWKTNWPLAKAWNVGITEAFEEGNDYVLVINDDAFVKRDTADKLVATLEINPDLYLLSAVEHLGDTATHFSCFMVAPKLFDRVGTFDENFNPIYFEDNDYIYRMNLLGVKHSGLHDALFVHKGSQTLKNKKEHGLGAQHDQEFRRNQEYYVKKWGGLPGKESYLNPYNNEGSVKEWILE